MTHNNICFGAYLYSAGTQHGNLHQSSSLWQWAVWPILFCRSTQEPALATANAGKLGKGLWKNEGECAGRYKLARKRFVAACEACKAIFWPTPGLKKRTLELWVLNRLVFNFCVRSVPQRGHAFWKLKSDFYHRKHNTIWRPDGELVRT